MAWQHVPLASQLSTDKLALEQQVSTLTAASQRLERELAAAAAKAGQQEAQLGELYELCTSQQGEAGRAGCLEQGANGLPLATLGKPNPGVGNSFPLGMPTCRDQVWVQR